MPGTTTDLQLPVPHGTPDRNGPHTPGPDPQPPTPADIAATFPSQSSSLSSSFPSSLRPFVPTSLSLHSIPPNDPAVYDAICAADTIGVFQIESRAQMSMLPRLKPRCFYDLVIEVAIVRPGPIQGGMIHPYLRRRNGQEQVTYPDERIRDVLAKTLGVPLFQEQVMRLAVVAAGFTPGEADQLRRAMAAWKRSGDLNPFQMRLMKGMLDNGYSREFAEVVFKQISGFAEYGFPESHAASFALLVYASAWIKLYHPAAFLAALINAQPLGFYTPAQLVADAIRHGVEVRPIDINASPYDCQLERRDVGTKGRRDEAKNEERRPVPPSERERKPGAMPKRSAGMPPSPPPDPFTRYGRAGPAVRLGMRVVRGISKAKVRGIEAAQREGPITSIRQLARRPDVSRQALVRLAAADAFRSLGLDRRQALWQILALDHVQQGSLFADLEPAEPEANLPPMSLHEQVVHDYDAIGLSLNAHPIGLLRDELNRLRVSHNEALRHSRPGQRISVAGLVTVRQRPMTAKGMVFMTLEDETGLANLILRPQVWDREGRKTRHKVAVIADGIIERQGDVIHVQVQHLHDLSARLVRLRNVSRNFR
ncbi:MAG: hypothetical protein JXO22_08900 [Phycisphaerae bacterium]|nr:hypothetical protein [Phycisphaerae bacterium]